MFLILMRDGVVYAEHDELWSRRLTAVRQDVMADDGLWLPNPEHRSCRLIDLTVQLPTFTMTVSRDLTKTEARQRVLRTARNFFFLLWEASDVIRVEPGRVVLYYSFPRWSTPRERPFCVCVTGPSGFHDDVTGRGVTGTMCGLSNCM